jgi:signal transduction histidine kinase
MRSPLRSPRVRRILLGTLPAAGAAALLLAVGWRWASVAAFDQRQRREAELDQSLRGDIAQAAARFGEWLDRQRRSGSTSGPPEVERRVVSYGPHPVIADTAGIFREAEDLEFVARRPDEARRAYERLLDGRLDSTQRLIALRNVARLRFRAHDDDGGLAALRDAARIDVADDGHRLRAACELARRDPSAVRALLDRLSSGAFAGADPGARVHAFESLGGEPGRVAGLRALAALLADDDPTAVVATEGGIWAWKTAEADGEFQLALVRAGAALEHFLPGTKTGRLRVAPGGVYRLARPLPAVDLHMGPAVRDEIEDWAHDAFWRRFAMTIGGALALFGGAAFVLVLERRQALADQRKQDFLFSITHELKTPIANVLLYAETISAHAIDDPEGARRFAGVVVDEAKRLLTLVQQTLDVAAGRRELGAAAETFSAEAVLREAVGAHEDSAAHDRIALTLAIPAADGARLRGSPELFARAIGGLLENALGHARSRVQVALEIDADRLRIAVEDDGPGVPPAERERIFEPFVRLAPHASRRRGGMGLGLTLVRQCAESGGGRVASADSDLGGARFVLDYRRLAAR